MFLIYDVIVTELKNINTHSKDAEEGCCSYNISYQYKAPILSQIPVKTVHIEWLLITNTPYIDQQQSVDLHIKQNWGR